MSAHKPIKPQAVFLAIHTEAPIYKDYEGLSEEKQQTMVPLVLMAQRWDGLTGFPGGTVDAGESVTEALVREMKEEVNYDLRIEDAQFVCVTETPRVTAYFYSQEVSLDVFKDILRHQVEATHFISEVSLFAVHLRDYPGKCNSLEQFMNRAFAPAVKEELTALFRHLGWDTKYKGACLG